MRTAKLNTEPNPNTSKILPQLSTYALADIKEFYYQQMRDEKRLIELTDKFSQASPEEQDQFLTKMEQCFYLTQLTDEMKISHSYFRNYLTLRDISKNGRAKQLPFAKVIELPETSWPQIQNFVRKCPPYIMAPDVQHMCQKRFDLWMERLKQFTELAEAKGDAGKLEKAWLEEVIRRSGKDRTQVTGKMKRKPHYDDICIFQMDSIRNFSANYDFCQVPLRDYILSLEEKDLRKWIARFIECYATLNLVFRKRRNKRHECFYWLQANRLLNELEEPDVRIKAALDLSALDPGSDSSIRHFISKFVNQLTRYFALIQNLPEFELHKAEYKFRACLAKVTCRGENELEPVFFKESLMTIHERKERDKKKQKKGSGIAKCLTWIGQLSPKGSRIPPAWRKDENEEDEKLIKKKD